MSVNKTCKITSLQNKGPVSGPGAETLSSSTFMSTRRESLIEAQNHDRFKHLQLFGNCVAWSKSPEQVSQQLNVSEKQK